MAKLLKLPNRPPFRELAAEYPRAFSTTKGLRLRILKRPKPGYSINAQGNRCAIECGSTSDLMRALGQWLSRGPVEAAEEPCMTFRGLMIDSSRNAVMKPSILKAAMLRLALFGYNALCLYTEDTYEVAGHPEFGYLRGRYTQAELRDLDRYAAKLGIEMFPCIQTLGHMEQILSHSSYSHLRDDNHILNLKLKETYEFIECLVESASKPYASRRIHLGLDETWGLSRGRAFVPNTPIDPRNDYLNHVSWLAELCRKKGLNPMMWGDIVIGMSGTEAFSEEQAARLPRDMKMVFWNYYSSDPEYYRTTIRKYRQMGFEPMVAPGLWSWGRLWSSQYVTDISASHFMCVAREEGIKEALMTMWGDSGHETPFASNYPAIAQFADDCWRQNPDRHDTEALVKAVCGTPFDVYTFPGRLDHFPGREEESIKSRANLSECILWDDPLLGIFARHYAGAELGPHFEKLASQIAQATRKASPDDARLFAYARSLASVVAAKCDLHNAAREAYLANDRQRVARVSRQIPDVIARTRKLLRAHTAVWLEERKPFGLEVLQIRYGGQLVRLAEMKSRLDAYLAGKIERIEEFDEPTVKLWPDPARFHGTHGRVATISTVR